MGSAKRNRNKLYVGHKIQRLLMVRTAIHWMACLSIVFVSMIFCNMFNSPSLGYVGNFKNAFAVMLPVVIVSLFFVPWLVLDTLRLSNRFAGPIVRIITDLRRVGNGDEINSLKLREDDLLHEFADEINHFVSRMKVGTIRTTDSRPTTLARHQ